MTSTLFKHAMRARKVHAMKFKGVEIWAWIVS